MCNHIWRPLLYISESTVIFPYLITIDYYLFSWISVSSPILSSKDNVIYLLFVQTSNHQIIATSNHQIIVQYHVFLPLQDNCVAFLEKAAQISASPLSPVELANLQKLVQEITDLWTKGYVLFNYWSVHNLDPRLRPKQNICLFPITC